MTFDEVKNEYERQRAKQRNLLSDFLSQHDGIKNAGLLVVRGGRAGTGKPHYISGKTEDHNTIAEYNLSNWKWVEVKNGDKDFDCTISLNMLDRDPNSGYIHALYDRIGLIFSPDPDDWFCTDIDLPFDNDKMDRIAQLVLEQFDCYQTLCKK